ncbi:hypothetical protein DL95DRAFT_292808 [Leptodontidium sp. 2 PMI_412]|nr:hypothetical protein DL95DRAFT_292808 [Leptodontidium sp. 2 PMI_412]
MQLYEDANGNAFLQSLTEVATPSARASQDPVTDGDLAKDVSNVRDALEKFTQASAKPITKDDQSQLQIKQSGSNSGPLVLTQVDGANEESLIPRLRHLVNNLSEYPTKIQNHEHRLELLENTSFSHAAIDDLQDADDRLDNRVCEVEERLRDVERAQVALNDASSVSSRQLVNSSFDSRASVTSSVMIASAMDRLDSSRVEVLEAQVAELQAAALPSHSRPWEVEVVFLPFGSRLMGIWSGQHSTSQRSRLNSTQTDGWTQTQNNSMAAAQACLTTHDQASAWERSATDLADQNSQWLMARACGLRSRVDERLRSRGLVRLIRILGPDARDVQAAMLKAFGDLPEVLTEDPYTQHDDENTGTVPRSLKTYLGLSAPWIPLRKIHKDSCLRYLNPSEMVTPALWTVPFLSASVAMRHSGIRRLYVTQRDSYIQQLGNNNADWTWQKLRQLPRVYPDQATPTTTSAHTTKRRIASFEHETQSSPSRAPSASAFSTNPRLNLNLNTLKRRRISRSPSRPRDTPRYSTGPPSPYAFFDDVNTKREEGMTPFAYATPHSNAPYIERARTSNFDAEANADNDEEGSTTDDLYADGEEGGEANALSDFDSDGEEYGAGFAQRQVDEEWEGVEDDLDLDHAHSNGYSPRLLPVSVGKSVPSGLRHGLGEHEMEDGDVDDQASDASSVPSEYPSRQPDGLFDLGSGLGMGTGKAGFRIHVDEEVE